MRAFIIVAALGLALNAGQGFAQSPPKMPSERPLNAEERAHVETLDRLLTARDNDALVKTALQPSNPRMLMTTLDWGKTRLFEGAGLTVALIQSRALWLYANAINSGPTRDSAALITLYSLLVVYADGVKCADKTAPTNRVQMIITNLRPQLDHLRKAPLTSGGSLGDVAMRMEKTLAPQRGDDNYLCRGGIQEYVDYLKDHPDVDKELPSRDDPSRVGRTIELPLNDPKYEPAFLPMGEWGPEQFLVREKFPDMVRRLTAATP